MGAGILVSHISLDKQLYFYAGGLNSECQVSTPISPNKSITIACEPVIALITAVLIAQ